VFFALSTRPWTGFWPRTPLLENPLGQRTLPFSLGKISVYSIRQNAVFGTLPVRQVSAQTHPALQGANRLSIFLSPLSKEEITYLRAPERNVSLHGRRV
jgi:hypothetical protein